MDQRCGDGIPRIHWWFDRLERKLDRQLRWTIGINVVLWSMTLLILLLP